MPLMKERTCTLQAFINKKVQNVTFRPILVGLEVENQREAQLNGCQFFSLKGIVAI